MNSLTDQAAALAEKIALLEAKANQPCYILVNDQREFVISGSFVTCLEWVEKQHPDQCFERGYRYKHFNRVFLHVQEPVTKKAVATYIIYNSQGICPTVW